jgi:mycothiol synthase
VPENASIRNFTWADVPAWTAIINELSGATGGEEELDTDFKHLFLSQPSLLAEDNCFIAEVGDVAAGMARVSHEPAISRAVAEVAVLPAHRRRGVGRQLLDRVIMQVGELQASVLHIQVPVLGRGGRFLLEDSGFNAARRYWRLAATVDGFDAPPLPDGYSIRHFELDRDEQILTDLQNAAFTGSWGFAPNTLEEISARVRLRPWESDGILLLQSDQEVCGYNWTQRSVQSDVSTGYIGMTGVHPDYRGKGLGRAIVSAGIEYLESKGAKKVELEVDHSNKPARELYLSLGFDLLGENVWYELNLAH